MKKFVTLSLTLLMVFCFLFSAFSSVADTNSLNVAEYQDLGSWESEQYCRSVNEVVSDIYNGTNKRNAKIDARVALIHDIISGTTSTQIVLSHSYMDNKYTTSFDFSLDDFDALIKAIEYIKKESNKELTLKLPCGLIVGYRPREGMVLIFSNNQDDYVFFTDNDISTFLSFLETSKIQALTY